MDRDLRDQRMAEEQLENRMSELRATLESTGDGILVVDMNGTVRHYNRRFVELWNVPPDAMEPHADVLLFAHLRWLVECKNKAKLIGNYSGAKVRL